MKHITPAQPSSINGGDEFPNLTISQLEEALEERVHAERRVNNDEPSNILIDRRVSDRRTVQK